MVEILLTHILCEDNSSVELIFGSGEICTDKVQTKTEFHSKWGMSSGPLRICKCGRVERWLKSSFTYFDE